MQNGCGWSRRRSPRKPPPYRDPGTGNRNCKESPSDRRSSPCEPPDARGPGRSQGQRPRPSSPQGGPHRNPPRTAGRSPPSRASPGGVYVRRINLNKISIFISLIKLLANPNHSVNSYLLTFYRWFK